MPGLPAGQRAAVMLAMGWAVVRSSREPFVRHAARFGDDHDSLMSGIDAVDDAVDEADGHLYRALRAYLSTTDVPDLDWQFTEQMNNHRGLLNFRASRNHRYGMPTAVALLYWLAENGPGSYGLVYLHDDEDDGSAAGRFGTDHRNVFRVWRLLDGQVDELADPFLSPIVPRIDPYDWA